MSMKMKIKTNEAEGWQLDYAVATCEGEQLYGVEDFKEQRTRVVRDGEFLYRYHQSWNLAGPIIERENINLVWSEGYSIMATIYKGGNVWIDAAGPNPLIAAMRCYVASKLGDEFEVPDAR